jgi:hypothetical protein
MNGETRGMVGNGGEPPTIPKPAPGADFRAIAPGWREGLSKILSLARLPVPPLSRKGLNSNEDEGLQRRSGGFEHRGYRFCYRLLLPDLVAETTSIC